MTPSELDRRRGRLSPRPWPRLAGRLAATAIAVCTAGAQAAEIGQIRAHLVYEGSGRLSGDILADPQFVGWNTIIGEGSAEEAANDLLVMVEVRSGGADYVTAPLEIVARGENGRIIARRSIDGILPQEGRAWKSLWLPDAGCAGTIRITATIERGTRTAELALNCGE